MSEASRVKVSLSLGGKRKLKKANANANVQEAFASDQAPKATVIERAEPLVIPVTANKLKFQHPRDVAKAPVDDTDAAAAKALAEEAEGVGASSKKISSLVIQNKANTFHHRELEQYQKDLEELPDEVPLESEQYQKVPIHEFGTALLRGMGWKGDSDDKSKGKDDGSSMPRPHRLGLGATPQMVPPTHSGRRPDQAERNERLQKQQDQYRKQREEQWKMDKQRTLQSGSLVRLASAGQRVKILQLVGVPGLNMVKVLIEGSKSPSIVKRGDLGDLLTRQELEEQPFREADQQVVTTSSIVSDKDIRPELVKSSKKRRRDEKEKTLSKHRRDDKLSSSDKPHWAIPRIRVRVVTEKLGRRYFRQKAVVVDVAKGATIRLDDGHVLDRVPERYLETALPKAGGNAIVLTGPHKYTKGQLLERDSKRNKAVIQIYEDMNVLTLKLDDIAEWTGPLDDDLGE